MKPNKITIQGSFLDCQIYRGWLYLWSFDGKLSIYNWNHIIESLCEDDMDKLAFKFAFQDGHFLYKQSSMELFSDTEFSSLLKTKFQRLEQLQLNLSEKELRRFLIGEMDTPSRRLPIDTEIYNSILYYCTEDGLFSANAHKTDGNPVSSRPSQLWDARILSIKADKYPRIAISAGNDGLFELSLAKTPLFSRHEQELQQIGNGHSSFANYSNLSVYSSSLIGKSYLALFNWEEDNGYIRKYSGTVDSEVIFGDNGKDLSWAVDGKIFRVSKSGFNIIRFSNNDKSGLFTKQTDYNNIFDGGDIIGGASAYFGNIVEFENSLSVILTDGNSLRINEPVTRWRIYPRSINYENQLHVLLEDRFEIYSFNHDYFISQVDKILGINFINDDTSRYKRY